MKKQMKRTVYEAPVTERFQVELEGSFCGSAEVQNPGPTPAGITDQTINIGFDSNNFEGTTGTDYNGWESVE